MYEEEAGVGGWIWGWDYGARKEGRKEGMNEGRKGMNVVRKGREECRGS